MAIHPAVAEYLGDWEQRLWLIVEEDAEIARKKAEAEKAAEPKREVLTVKKANSK